MPIDRHVNTIPFLSPVSESGSKIVDWNSASSLVAAEAPRILVSMDRPPSAGTFGQFATKTNAHCAMVVCTLIRVMGPADGRIVLQDANNAIVKARRS